MTLRVHSRSVEMTPFDRSHTSSYWRSTAVSFIIAQNKRDIGRKLRFFHTSSAFDAPVKGSRRNIAKTFGRPIQKPDGETSLRICLLFSIQCTNVTDGQTPHDSMGRAMHSVARQKTFCFIAYRNS